MNQPSSLQYRFADFCLDAAERRLLRCGVAIPLAPRVFDTLVLLLENSGHLIEKEEFMKKVWPETFVGDDALARNISILRKVLGGSSESQSVIATVPKRGYRFVAEVTHNGLESENFQTADLWHIASGLNAQADMAMPQTASLGMALPSNSNGNEISAATVPVHSPATWPSRVGRVPFLFFTIVLGTIAGVATFLLLHSAPSLNRYLFGKSDALAIHSIAVLPLQNLSGDSAQEYLSDGMTDALITDLAQIGSLRVISRTSTIRYKKSSKSLPEIAHELNVDGIVEGTVQRSGDRVRVTAQLIDAGSDRNLWASSYERDMRDLFTLERDVTQDIARQVKGQLTTSDRAGRVPPRPMAPKAVEAYLQGNYHLNRQGAGFGDEEKRKAAEYFQQAIDADPNFAPAYHGLVHAHELLWRGSNEDIAIARRAGQKAVEIDPNFAAARVNLAGIKWTFDLDLRGAEADIKQVTVVSPNSAWAHSALCILLIDLGNSEEGLRECRIAQRLDPLDDDSALGLYYGREYDDSIAMLRTMLQGDPKVGLWHSYLFPDYAMKGMHEEAIQELQQCFSLYGFPRQAANIQRAFETSGYREAIHQWAKEMEGLHETRQAFLPGDLAIAYTILGDKDRAFYWLEQAYEHREMVSFDSGISVLGAEPLYDPLRSDPRFKDLLRRVGVP
jgi:TolB-like protein/DNA-binding winged helix-turn-helix (wHTH) protein